MGSPPATTRCSWCELRRSLGSAAAGARSGEHVRPPVYFAVLPKSDMAPKKKTNRKNKADGNDVQIINGIKETAKNEINFLNNNFDFKELCSSVTELSNPHHSDQILEGQKAMQMDGFLCDLTLSVKTKTFHVHKLVMASCSDHIRTLLRQDSGTQQLELNDIAAVGLATAILYTYSGSVNLSLQNVSSVVATAVRLQMHSLLKLCCDFMEQALNVENCMYVSNVAKTFDLHNTRETAEKFIRENFVEFSETDQFLKLSFDQINQLLLDDSLEINSELTAFHIALKWLEHDSKRLAYAAELLSNIRFGTISAHDLVTYVQTVPRMMQDPECHKLLVDAMNYHLLPYQQNVMQSRRTKLRGGAKVLVTVGGRPALVEKSLSRDVLYRDPETGWVKLTEMVSKSFNQCIAVMDGFLYVAGGEDQNDARNQAKHAVSTFCRFDARFNMWIQLAGMLHKRTHFSFSACNGLLFAIGGRNSEGPLSAMECYVPSTNQWQPKASLDVARCCHASATANGRVLVTGGYINNAYSRTACSYEVTSDSWHEKAPLSTPRGWHCSVSLGERVYVAGGSQLGPRGERVDVLTVEMYNPFTGQWSYVSPLPTGVSTAGATMLGRRVLLAGGWNEAEKKYKKCIQSFDPEVNAWLDEEELPEAVVGVSCCSLLMPHRRVRDSRASSVSSMPLSI